MTSHEEAELNEFLAIIEKPPAELSSLEREYVCRSLTRDVASRSIIEYELQVGLSAEIAGDDLLVTRRNGSSFRAIGGGQSLIAAVIAEAEAALAGTG